MSITIAKKPLKSTNFAPHDIDHPVESEENKHCKASETIMKRVKTSKTGNPAMKSRSLETADRD